jgi:hypothetical protein
VRRRDREEGGWSFSLRSASCTVYVANMCSAHRSFVIEREWQKCKFDLFFEGVHVGIWVMHW